jgi:uncharacterized membrane protein
MEEAEKMFFILFIVLLFIFLTIKSVDMGFYGTVHYWGNILNEPQYISRELYSFFIVLLFIFGLLAIRDIVRLFTESDNKKDKNNYIEEDKKNNLSIDKLIELHSKNLINDEEFLEMKKKIKHVATNDGEVEK